MFRTSDCHFSSSLLLFTAEDPESNPSSCQRLEKTPSLIAAQLSDHPPVVGISPTNGLCDVETLPTDNGSHDADIEPGETEPDSLSLEQKERLSTPDDDSSVKRKDSESVICTAGTSLKPDPQENGADHNDCEDDDDEGERVVDRETIKTENGKQTNEVEEETDDAREEDESKERSERMKEYLKRSDTQAVIFPESVSVFGLKDCLTNDQEQDEACRKKRNDLKNSSKVAGSVSEYLIFSYQFSRSQVVVHSVLILVLRC